MSKSVKPRIEGDVYDGYGSPPLDRAHNISRRLNLRMRYDVTTTNCNALLVLLDTR